MFISDQTLAKFCGLRVRYLFAILSECFNIVPDFTLIRSTQEQKNFFKELGDLPQKDCRSSVTIFTCDSLLSADDWVTTWSSLLSSHTTLDGLLADMTHRFDLKVKVDTVETKVDTVGTKAPQKIDEAEKDGGEEADDAADDDDDDDDDADDDDDDDDDDDADDGLDGKQQQMTVWTPSLVNSFVFFAETSASGNKLKDSAEVKALALGGLSVIFLRRFEASLELLLWNVWQKLMTKVDDSVVLDPSSSSSKEQIMVKYPTPLDLILPFTGHVTSQTSDPKAIHIGTIFGLKFFLTPSANICVPAWSVKTVTRLDQAFFSYHANSIKVLLVLGKDPRKHSRHEVVFGDIDLFIVCDVAAYEQEAEAKRLAQQKDTMQKPGTFISEKDTRHALHFTTN